MRIPAITMLAATTALATDTHLGGLTITGPKCGELQCALTEYCNFSERCEDCSVICDTSTHNFEESICMNNCQNFLHDLRYMKVSSENTNLAATVASLEKKVHSLTLTCAILLFFVIALGLAVLIPRSKGFYYWISEKFQRKKKVHCAPALTHENPHTESPVAPHRARVQQTNIVIPPPSQATPSSGSDISRMTTPTNNVSNNNNSTLNNSMAFTISNPGALSHAHEYEQMNNTIQSTASNTHPRAESQIPLHSSTPMETTFSDTSFVQRSAREREVNHDETPLNVRNLNRFASSHGTIPDTPDTQSTRVEDLYLSTHTTRLPSEDCIVELKEDKNLDKDHIEYNPPQRQVIYTSLNGRE